jgi:hypothetical protein
VQRVDEAVTAACAAAGHGQIGARALPHNDVEQLLTCEGILTNMA